MPDLNSVPPSPRALASRQHSSQQMPPPSSTTTTGNNNNSSSLNILPSNQSAVNNGSSSTGQSPRLTAAQPVLAQPAGAAPGVSPGAAAASDVGVGPGPGPLRHPRPLTAMEMHTQLEKEQEALVNRLSRELSILRAAHNASVASNTSSTSAGTSTHEPVSDASLLSGSGFSIPSSRRHTRTSSSASQSHILQPISVHDARFAGARPPQAIPLSRQDSSTSRHSQTTSPAMSYTLDPSSYFHQQRVPMSTSVPASSVVANAGSAGLADQMSPTMVPATFRYEETTFYRGELETAKKENESLKKRIRELEKLVKEKKDNEASRTRSESVNSTASASIAAGGGSNIAPPRDSGASTSSRPERDPSMTSQNNPSHTGSIAVGVPEEDLQVGQSASSFRPSNPSNRRP